MGSLIKGSINLNKLPKEKLIKGKNGTYYDFTISVNDETGQFGDNCHVPHTSCYPLGWARV